MDHAADGQGQVLDQLRPGDTLVVWKLDRLGRSLRHLVDTVTSLADSRFDWPRVMRELGLVLPDDVTLTNLDASAALGEGGEAANGVVGPSLELEGCTSGQDAVATFITALKDIDGGSQLVAIAGP